MERRTILPGFVGDALASLTRSGLDPAPVLAKAGIADPDQPVSNLQYGWLWLAITDLIQDEFFGMGERPMRSGSFTLLCHCVLHAKTLDQALEIKNTQIAEELALPPVKIHCSILAEDAIKAAVADYKKKQGE